MWELNTFRLRRGKHLGLPLWRFDEELVQEVLIHQRFCQRNHCCRVVNLSPVIFTTSIATTGQQMLKQTIWRGRISRPESLAFCLFPSCCRLFFPLIPLLGLITTPMEKSTFLSLSLICWKGKFMPERQHPYNFGRVFFQRRISQFQTGVFSAPWKSCSTLCLVRAWVLMIFQGQHPQNAKNLFSESWKLQKLIISTNWSYHPNASSPPLHVLVAEFCEHLECGWISRVGLSEDMSRQNPALLWITPL